MKGHVGALYSVRVRTKRKGDAYQTLGDIDGEGGALIYALDGYLPELSASTEDTLRDVSVVSHTIDDDTHELRVLLNDGRRGVGADIFDHEREFKARQLPGDTSQVKCGALLRLDPAEKTGWLVSHVSNGRSVKSLLVNELIRLFRDDFQNLVLEVRPAALGPAVRKAVSAGRVDSVKLVKLDRPRDRANTSEGKWVRADHAAKLTLTIEGWKSRLVHDRIGRYLQGGEPDLYGEITEFHGINFDDVHVEVELENGQHRTFNLERPDSGHALTQDLVGLRFDDTGDPNPDTLFAALGDVIDALPD